MPMLVCHQVQGATECALTSHAKIVVAAFALLIILGIVMAAVATLVALAAFKD